MTIDESVRAFTIILFSGMLLTILVGWSQIQSARKLPYFTLRREKASKGIRWIGLGLVLGLIGVLSIFFGSEAVYILVPPTPSVTPTPSKTATATITSTPSITPVPSITPTATNSPTPTITPTPMLPAEIEVLIRESITPDPDSAFSPIVIAPRLGSFNQPLGANEEFELPLTRLYGTFTYDSLQDGVRWTAIWLLGDKVVCIETQPWDGGTGGYGFTECELESWLPGRYEIRMFYGSTWKRSIQFDVLAGTSTPTLTASP